MSLAAEQFRMIEIKALDGGAPGSFEGLLSPYDVVDQGNDMVCKGAFKKTIADNGGKIPLLWQHNPDDPIGTIELIDREDGLHVKGQLILDDAVPNAKKAHVLVKHDVVKGMSIGFKTIQKEMDDGVRKLKEIKLVEGSIVTMPMAKEAQIYSMKAVGDGSGDFNDELDESITCSAGYQSIYTLQSLLQNAWWQIGNDDDGDGAEDMPTIIAYAESCIDQFKETFMAALAKYGAMSNSPDDADKQVSVRIQTICREIKAGKTSRVDGEDLPSSAFLIVGDPDKTDTWKLPVKFTTPEKTKAHIRNALARFNQMTGVDPATKAKAYKRLVALAKENGIKVADAGKSSTAPDTKPVATPETKAGKTISSETADTLGQAHAHVAQAVGSMTLASTLLTSLISPPNVSNNGYPTSTEGVDAAGKSAGANMDEPDTDPLDLKQQLAELNALFAKAS